MRRPSKTRKSDCEKMKRIIYFLWLWTVVFSAPAQDLSFLARQAPWFQAFFAKINPGTPEFTTKGEMSLCNSNGAAQFVLPMDLAVSTNCLRWDVNVMKIWPMPPQAQAAAAMIHMDKIIFLARMNQKRVFMIYPGVQAYFTLPIPDSVLTDFNAQKNSVQFEKTELGHETVNGHPCIKSKMVDVEPNRPPQQGLIWCATDLQEFPVRMELHVRDGLMKFDFPDVQIAKPAASLFIVPTNYVEFANSVEISRYAKEKFQQSLNVVPK